MGNEDLIQQLESKKQDILNKAQQDVAQIDSTIHTLKYLSSSFTGVSNQESEDSDFLSKYAGYKKEWIMRDKIKFILKTESKFLHLRQIGQILHKLEPKTSIEDHIARCYTPMGQLKKENTVYKFSVGSANVNTFWGSVNWVSGTGEIKEGYKYDEDQIRIAGGKSELEL